jgi:hypothetical protein
MNLDLAAIGLTPEDLQDRVVECLTNKLYLDTFADDEGNICGRPKAKLDEHVNKLINNALAQYAEKTLTPAITSGMACLIIHNTNEYGEKKGPPLTLTEYVTKAADNYLREQVNHEGKAKSQGSYDSYNWKPESSRAFWLLNKSIQENVNVQINAALATVNTEVASAVSTAVKAQIEKIQKAFIAKT